MANLAKTAMRLYGPQEVASLIGENLRRVKNFVQADAYGIKPSAKKGKQRRFTFEQVFKLALANQLVRCGFAPEAVGRAIKAVPDSLWQEWAVHYEAEPQEPLHCVLFAQRGEWSVKRAAEARDTLQRALDANDGESGVFTTLNLSAFFESFWERIRRYMFGGVSVKLPVMRVDDIPAHGEQRESEGSGTPKKLDHN